MKQSPRQWYLRFDTFIQGFEFLRYEHDPCVYVKNVDIKNTLYLLLYVDDILIESRSMKAVKGQKRALSDEFEGESDSTGTSGRAPSKGLLV